MNEKFSLTVLHPTIPVPVEVNPFGINLDRGYASLSLQDFTNDVIIGNKPFTPIRIVVKRTRTGMKVSYVDGRSLETPYMPNLWVVM